MKKDKIIYWVSTAIIGVMMLLSAYSYFTNPQIGDGFKHLGFPDYFRQELGLAKLIGALLLLIPQIPSKIKEWTYAGFGIVFISASFAHFSSGDATPMVITPIVLFGILVISNIYLSKVNKVAN